MSNSSIGILDYGAGNIASISNMINRIGGKAKILKSPVDLSSVEKIVLPGVGAFDNGMRCLGKGGWLKLLNAAVVDRKTPVLGICLGMQLMCKTSEEGVLPGLGWIDANVIRFRFSDGLGLKIPHMGWNSLDVKSENPLISFSGGERRFYFVHSYYVKCNNREDVIATACHGFDFDAAFCHENIYGVQFHPEKSHRFGMEVLSKFVEL